MKINFRRNADALVHAWTVFSIRNPLNCSKEYVSVKYSQTQQTKVITKRNQQFSQVWMQNEKSVYQTNKIHEFCIMIIRLKYNQKIYNIFYFSRQSSFNSLNASALRCSMNGQVDKHNNKIKKRNQLRCRGEYKTYFWF